MSNEPINTSGWPALLFVMSAPSGAGKTTLVDRLCNEFSRLQRAITCTTRPPRPEETNGVDYHFFTREEFERRARSGDFLEHALVHGHCYGSLHQPVVEALASGRDVLMNLDVQGAASVRAALDRARPGDPLHGTLVDIFVLPPSRAVLEGRLRKRATDTADDIARRLRGADGEMARQGEFQYRVINDRLDQAYDELRAIYLAEHLRQRGGATPLAKEPRGA